MAKMGRPLIKIDQAQFEKLCSIMCTLTDIAGFFDCSPDTIENWCKKTYHMTFSDIYKRKSANGRVSLRRKQFEVAMSGDKVMLIWLGKQQLGQRDTFPEEIQDTPVVASIYKLHDANKSKPEAS
jgi:hypothetical protein